VYAIPVDPGNRGHAQSARSYQGAFSLELPEPGDYFVAIAIGDDEDGRSYASLPRDRDWPHPIFYYPGVSETVGAAVLPVEGGTVVELTDWTLPSSLTDRRLSGRVIYSNGDIPSEAAVELARPGTEESVAVVDAGPDGTFEVHLLNGVPYELRAIALQGGVFHEGRLLVQPDSNSPVTIPLVNVGLQPSSRWARDVLQKIGLQ
jgi:hypothetical protein